MCKCGNNCEEEIVASPVTLQDYEEIIGSTLVTFAQYQQAYEGEFPSDSQLVAMLYAIPTVLGKAGLDIEMAREASLIVAKKVKEIIDFEK